MAEPKHSQITFCYKCSHINGFNDIELAVCLAPEVQPLPITSLVTGRRSLAEVLCKNVNTGQCVHFQARDPEKCGHPGHKEKLSEGLYRCENCGAKLRSETEPGTHGRREWWVLVKE